MSRPANETRQNLEDEESARKRLSEAWRCQILKLRPALYYVDWALYRTPRSQNQHREVKQELAGWAEYKRRSGPSTKYELWQVSHAKWMHLKWLSERSLVPFMLALEWDDGLFFASWTHVSGATYPMTTMVNDSREEGRQDGDLEPAIAIPRTEFKRLGG